MVSIIPLMVWGGTGSAKRAWEALRQYLGIMGAAVLVVSVLAILLTLGEVIDRG